MRILHHTRILSAGLGMQLLLHGLLKGGLMGAPMLGGVQALTDSVSYISCLARPANYSLNTTSPMVWPDAART